MAVSGSKGRSLESTPTWAVAVVCFLLVAISILIEHFMHHIESWLRKKRNSSLHEAHEKIKTELMLLGFMSLLLTVGQEVLPEFCIPTSVGHSWHPCTKEKIDEQYQDPCEQKGKVQFVSAYGVNQLHKFIFVLAVSHVLCCVTTIGLGRLKIKKWKSWEDETKTIQYQCYNDPERFRFARETTFGRRHLHFWSKSPVLLWIVCFFGQFFTSVAKVDYLTLRHGFITAHLTPQSQATFNFQKYINRSLEEDFKVVVGISPVIWLSAVLFLLTYTNGWYSHFWLPFIPLIIILLIGAKFQVIIKKMGISILERGVVIKGTPVVQPGDDLFWFNRPGLILFLIHLVLYQNAFQLAFFAWSWYQFGYPSCYHENLEEMIIRITMGVLIQVLCSYVTLPLYALVAQMGSSMKPVIFSEQVVSALRAWHQTARKQIKQGRRSGSTTPLQGGMSPVHLLRGHRNNDSNEGGYQISSRALPNFSNEGRGGGGGGEGTSASPGHHDLNDSTRNSRHHGEIERDVEDHSLTNRAQLEGQISLRDFSFRNKQYVAGMSGSK
ncbi:hypothetical protein Pfo_027119 [Paulownia fortunei]|nr:hypothetical protein Pfo_027119 [Paulownia fortunei]